MKRTLKYLGLVQGTLLDLLLGELSHSHIHLVCGTALEGIHSRGVRFSLVSQVHSEGEEGSGDSIWAEIEGHTRGLAKKNANEVKLVYVITLYCRK